MRVSWMLTDQTVDLALASTAQMFGLPRETVTRILRISLAMVAERARGNPELLRRLYALSKPALPAPPREFYDWMVESAAIRQEVMDDFRATFGTMLDAVHREAARQAETTDGQARETFAGMLPAVSVVLGKANTEGTERGFAEELGDLLLRDER